MPVSTHGELCGDCWTAMNWIDGPKCAKCGYSFVSDLDTDVSVLCPVCAAGKTRAGMRQTGNYDALRNRRHTHKRKP